MNRFCCPNHPDTGFDLTQFFPGMFLMSQNFTFVEQVIDISSTTRRKYRPKKEREPLKAVLYAWRSHAHNSDRYRAVRQISWILTDAEIDLISKTVKTKLKTIHDLATLLDAREDWVSEWGAQVMGKIQSFDSKS
jgi:hypothetical protein